MVVKRFHKGKRVIGLPINHPITWTYSRGKWNERKVGHGKWKFSYNVNKRRKAKRYGGLGKGSTGKWLIKAIQTVKKTGKGMYNTSMKGTKKSLGFNVKKPKVYKQRGYKKYKK